MWTSNLKLLKVSRRRYAFLLRIIFGSSQPARPFRSHVYAHSLAARIQLGGLHPSPLLLGPTQLPTPPIKSFYALWRLEVGQGLNRHCHCWLEFQTLGMKTNKRVEHLLSLPSKNSSNLPNKWKGKAETVTKKIRTKTSCLRNKQTVQINKRMSHDCTRRRAPTSTYRRVFLHFHVLQNGLAVMEGERRDAARQWHLHDNQVEAVEPLLTRLSISGEKCSHSLQRQVSRVWTVRQIQLSKNANLGPVMLDSCRLTLRQKRNKLTLLGGGMATAHPS